jgi:hypothetical protein
MMKSPQQGDTVLTEGFTLLSFNYTFRRLTFLLLRDFVIWLLLRNEELGLYLIRLYHFSSTLLLDDLCP